MENKETLELAAERFLIRELNLSKIQVETLYSDYIKAVVKFHKWQQGQDKKKFSEEDLRDCFYNAKTPFYKDFREWFSQFKKQEQ
jgi:hypothetical protein